MVWLDTESGLSVVLAALLPDRPDGALYVAMALNPAVLEPMQVQARSRLPAHEYKRSCGGDLPEA
jgi:hypothetical protein